MTQPPSPQQPSSPQQPPRGPQDAGRPPINYGGQGWDEQIWRRPADGSGNTPPPFAPATRPAPTYAGPPPTIPAGPGWRPRMLIEVPPARSLPEQIDAVLDERERSQRTVTYGVGMMVGAIALIVLFVLCGRLLF